MIEDLSTEKRNSTTVDLDRYSVEEIIIKMNQEGEQIAKAVGKELTNITKLVEAVSQALKKGGHLFYIGVGTSGRLSVLDAAECIPTFNTKPEMVQEIIAGGMKAMTVAVEGVEDSFELAEINLKERGLEYATKVGATTVALSCNYGAIISQYVNYSIEVLTGSTRLKSGTAQKFVLNMISTATMIQLGKVYQNLMVDVQPTNEKLIERSRYIIMEATGCTYEDANFYFKDSNNQLKLAIVRLLSGLGKEEADQLLLTSAGFVGRAIEASKR